MKKDFDAWIRRKKKLDEIKTAPFFRVAEIWWCALGVNIGSEEDGKGTNFDRPILVVRAFNRNSFLGVALIGRRKEGIYYFGLGHICGVESSVVLSQVRFYDARRLIRRMAVVSSDKFQEIKKSLMRILLE